MGTRGSRPRRPPRRAHVAPTNSARRHPGPDSAGQRISAARVEGAFVTLIIGGRDAEGPSRRFDPCVDYHPRRHRVAATQVIIERRRRHGASDGTPWAHCLECSSAARSSWRQPLRRPCADRLAEPARSSARSRSDERRHALPDRAPRALRRSSAWDEWGGRGTAGRSTGSSRRPVPQRGHRPRRHGRCAIQSERRRCRGTSGRLCYDESDGRFEPPAGRRTATGASWPSPRRLGPRPRSETIGDVVAVAEGLVASTNQL